MKFDTFARQMAPKAYSTSLFVGPNVRSMETYLCWDPQPRVSWCDQPGKVHSWNHTELSSFPCLSYILCNEAMTSYVANDFHGFGDDRNFHLTKDSILIGYGTGRTALFESCFMARVATQHLSSFFPKCRLCCSHCSPSVDIVWPTYKCHNVWINHN